MPYVEENGKHFGGLRWASGTEGNCLQVGISPPVSRSGKALSTVLYSGSVWLKGIHGRHVKSSILRSIDHGTGGIENGKSCDLDYEVKSRRDAGLDLALGTKIKKSLAALA
jgi:hypothetical protein